MTAAPIPLPLAALLLAATLAGCAIERPLVMESAPADSPVSAAPTAPVTGSALPPPPGASASEAVLAPPPAAPPGLSSRVSSGGSTGISGGFPSIIDESPAPLPPSAASEPPRIAPGAQAAGLGGTWTLAGDGQNCQIVLREPPASRAGWAQAEPQCGSLAGATSWTLTGSSLFLYDRDTRPLARLTSSGPNRFDGTATQGATISLTR
ncbi:AprI/Inh family metalloprotease inhibitor [Blastochloris sulfoviridis]|uniref:Alkaline proteinase inhibitor/ Outer membrane lipoprotein Omp19 domain-containing protein n=1 Tax=Blastochloris sulfoviridis TaxID=50712 RepID=A0A5M6HUQ5_9HYPH|nr:AprI/Inh family metalloprotease inhibitor [Blastochloris sulfoviridis]KAA5599592.1 hypothetical protein F1193_11700 [Blastochloris sulfoviridis]